VAPSREQIADWLDGYFEAVNSNQGALEVVGRSRKYFSPDLKFTMYTATTPEMRRPLNREQLLMTFVHPGLHERLTPNYYVIDAEALRAVVQFSLVFRDEASGKEWPVKQASAHYQLESGPSGELLIAEIQYWTEIFGDEFRPMFQLWHRARDEALTESKSQYARGSE